MAAQDKAARRNKITKLENMLRDGVISINYSSAVFLASSNQQGMLGRLFVSQVSSDQSPKQRRPNVSASDDVSNALM
jgi:hypothetical protein